MNKELINVPNTLLIIRILLVPIIVILLLLPIFIGDSGMIYKDDFDFVSINYSLNWTDLVAGLLFVIAALTDYIDGWWARKYNQVTRFGKLFDPLADKILVNSTLIIFGARGIIPIIFVILFVIRDILVDGLRMMLASDGIVLAADRYGKLKTLFQMIGLTLLFFIHPYYGSGSDWFSIFEWKGISPVIIAPIGIGLLFSIISGVNYYIKGFKKYRQK